MKRSPHVKVSFIIVLQFFAITVFAQYVADSVEPRPFVLTRPLYDMTTTGKIKKVVMLTDLDRYNGLQNDTTLIYYYDEMGMRIEQVRYGSNHPKNRLVYQYDGYKIISSKEIDPKTNKAVKESITGYDAKGRIASYTLYVFTKNDTAGHLLTEYHYDSEGRLLSVSSPGLRNVFRYQKQKLVEMKSWLSPQNQSNYLRTVYQYNADGLLSEQRKFQLVDTCSSEFEYHFYNYKNGRLQSERYASGPFKVETGVSYSYNESGLLEDMLVKRDTLYKKVQYEYKGGKPQHITVESNQLNGLSREFYIPLYSLQTAGNSRMVYEEEWTYNEKGHVVKKVFSLNGQIEKIVEFLVEYY